MFSGKIQPGDKFFSLIYSIPHTKPWVSAGVHTLAKKSCFSRLFVSHPPDYKVCEIGGEELHRPPVVALSNGGSVIQDQWVQSFSVRPFIVNV